MDSQKKKFSVPQDRNDNLLALIEQMLSSASCTLQDLERCVGKCRSMSIAVPCAVLYTRAQYTALSNHLDQLTSAKRVCFIALMVLFHAGYFVNIDKSVLDPTSLIRHLGITFGGFPEEKVFSATRQK